MNEKAKTLLKNLNYTVSANFFVLGISVILNLVIPKFIGVREYSFWQLYVFYSSYVGFFHFGWLDGIYLKIGGAEYDDLDRRSLGTQFWYLTITQSILGLMIMIYGGLQPSGNAKSIILIFTALNLIVTNVKYFSLYILQSTNRIKDYAQISRGDRYIYIVGVGIYFLLHGQGFAPLIALDVFSKVIMLVWGMVKIKDLLIIKPISFKKISIEIFENIKVGSNLMISNIASVLILGISRVMVEQQWSIETFGKLSFTLSISNMFMTFINAVGIVMFPLLRRTKKEKLSWLYLRIREIFVPITYSFLLFFIPIKVLLNFWLPEYSESLTYMGVLFPMVIYEGRMALLVSTYLKTIRREKLILLSNIVTLVISVVLSTIAIYVIKNIFLAVLIIMFSLAFRCIFAERLLLNILGLKLMKEIAFESVLTIMFIGSNIFAIQGVSFIVYFVAFGIYLYVNHIKIKYSLKELVGLMRI